MNKQDEQLIQLKKDQYAQTKGFKDWASFIVDLFFSGKGVTMEFHVKEVFKEVEKAKRMN